MATSGDGSGTVGLVGIGSLGLAIARNLLERGNGVVGYRRSAMDDFARAGGDAASSPADVARRANVVFTCLPSGAALTEVVSGRSGLLDGISEGSVVFDLSTVPLAAMNSAREALAEKDVQFLDCTVSGNPNYVGTRTAAIFVSGEEEMFDRYRPVLADITDNVAFVGPFGAGTALKLITALLIPIHTLAAAEAFAIATRAGLDRQVVYDAIEGTPASSGMFETRGKAMVTGEHSRAISIEGYIKNIDMAVDLAETLGGEYPLLTTMRDIYGKAVESGFGGVDQSVVFDYLMGEK